MAEKKQTHSYEAILRDIKARRFSPVYVLMGEESYYIDRITNALIDSVLTAEEKDFNESIFFGSDVNITGVIDMARSYPVMSDYRLVVVKEAQAMRNLEKLDKYLDNIVKTTILVICYKNGTMDTRKKWISKVSALGVIYESKRKRDYELASFINGYLSLKQVSIDDKASQMIAENIGADLNRISSELDKMLIALPQNENHITAERVEKSIGVSKDFNGFELKEAIIHKNIFKANQIIQYFDKNPKAGSIFAFLPLLFTYFQNLLIAYYAPNRINEQSVAQHLDLKSVWQVREYMEGMRNYSAMKAMYIIDKIREVDVKSKGVNNPSTSTGELMKELIYFILH